LYRKTVSAEIEGKDTKVCECYLIDKSVCLFVEYYRYIFAPTPQQRKNDPVLEKCFLQV